MKISEILARPGPSVSFEVFPPKKDRPLEGTKEIVAAIAAERPSFMSVTYGAAGGSTGANTRAIAEHVQSACAVPVLPDGRILLIRQLRPVIDRKTWELPAGARDHQEDPSVTAARELFEETGYRAGRITPLLVLKTAPAWCDEETHVYLAEDLTREGDQCLDEAEEIDMAAFPLPELLARIRSGELQDAKTVAGILMYAQVRSAET